MGIGVFIGVEYRELAVNLSILGEVYLALLQMCIIPIMITAVPSSLGQLLISGEATAYVGKIFVVFLVGLLIASAVGLGVGIIAKPGAKLSKSAQVTLGKKITETNIKGSLSEKKKPSSPAILNFFKEIVASNIVGAISKGKNLPVLVFFILLGIALGLIRSPAGKNVLEIINVFYEAILKIITWIMYGLPFGLCFLLASQISQVGLDIMFALLKLIISTYICAFIMIALYALVTWLKMRRGSFFRSFVALKDTFVVALGTSSSFASIPSALNDLENKLYLDKKVTKLVVPLGINLNPHGAVVHFALSSVFIAQVYGVSLNPSSWIIILIGSVLAGLAATGAPGAGALSMISVVLHPLGLPVSTAIILLAAIDPIVDPILTLTTVHANCSATTLIAEKEPAQEQNVIRKKEG